jgi:transcriptional regulator with XRE-family HTH domain
MASIQERIKELIKSEGLTNSEFAGKMDMNPSIISHILSGRNKTSLQVVESIKTNFTNVNLEYLITGIGELYSNVTNVNNNVDKILESNQQHQQIPRTSTQEREPDIDKKITKVETEPDVYYSSPPPALPKTERKEAVDGVDQIIVFYTDGSFKRYHERKD